MKAEQFKQFCKTQSKLCRKNKGKLQVMRNNGITDMIRYFDETGKDETLFVINCANKIWSKITNQEIEYGEKHSCLTGNIHAMFALKYLCGIEDTDIIYSFYGDIQWFFDLPPDCDYTQGMIKDIVINDQTNRWFSINCSDYSLCKYCINCSVDENNSCRRKTMYRCYDCINCCNMEGCRSCIDCTTCVDSKFLTCCERVYSSKWCTEVYDSDRVQHCRSCRACQCSRKLILCTYCIQCDFLINCNTCRRASNCIGCTNISREYDLLNWSYESECIKNTYDTSKTRISCAHIRVNIDVKSLSEDEQWNYVTNICSTNFKKIVYKNIDNTTTFEKIFSLKQTYNKNSKVLRVMMNKMNVYKTTVSILNFVVNKCSSMPKQIIDINDEGYRVEIYNNNGIELFDSENNLMFAGLMSNPMLITDKTDPLKINVYQGTFYYTDIHSKMCDVCMNNDYRKIECYWEKERGPWECGIYYRDKNYTPQEMKRIVKQRQLTIGDIIRAYKSDVLLEYIVNRVLSGEYNILDVYDRNSKFVYSYITFEFYPPSTY